MFLYLLHRVVAWCLGTDNPHKYWMDTIHTLTSHELFTPVEGYWDAAFKHEATIRFERLGVVIISIIANCSVLTFHLTHTPHPKFLIHWRRKFMIKLHIFCGTCEMLSFVSVAVFRLPCLALVEVVACYGHVATSFYMMSGLFGIRNVMAPCYFAAICVHAINGTRLFFQLKDPERAIETFLALQIYVWVRVIYVFLLRFGIMTKYLYTLSVVLAGFTVGPSCSWSGVMAGWEILLIMLIWNGFSCPCCEAKHPHLDEERRCSLQLHEVTRESMVMKFMNSVKSMVSTVASGGGSPSSAGYASMSSQASIEDPNRQASVIDTRSSQRNAPLYEHLAKQSSDDAVTTEAPFHVGMIKSKSTNNTFGSVVTDQSRFVVAANTDLPQQQLSARRGNSGQPPLATATSKSSLASNIMMINQVFVGLCKNPAIGLVEGDLEILLAVWGLPYTEAALVMAELRPKLKNPEVISFDEFREHLSFIWHYAKEILESDGMYEDYLE